MSVTITYRAASAAAYWLSVHCLPVILIRLYRFSGLGMSDVSTPLVFGMFEIALRICASTSAFADWLCRPRTRARRRACAFSADGPETAKKSRANMLVSAARSEEHTSELQQLMRIANTVSCL